jgi:hypothetical protein
MELQQRLMDVLVIVLAKTVTNSDLGKFVNVFIDTAGAATAAVVKAKPHGDSATALFHIDLPSFER